MKKKHEVLPIDINEFVPVPHGVGPKRKALVVLTSGAGLPNPSVVNALNVGPSEDFSARMMVVMVTPTTGRYPVSPGGIYNWDDTATYYKEV
jgi:hypothetical protein